MRKILYILLLFSFIGHSQKVIRMTSSGKVLNGRFVHGVGGAEPSAPSATITATDGTATESGTTTGTFTVTLSAASSGTTTIDFTVSGTATSGSDYTSIGTSVNITDGNTTGTITVTPIDDIEDEGTETVIVTLASGTGYTVGSPSQATVNITDDDAVVAGNANWFDANPSVSEPADGTTYTPNSEADITNATNAGKTAIISSSFSCSGCTFAANQKIRPAGGVISGTNINLNGAYIDNVADQAFSSSATFSSIYEDSWVYVEVFGAVANDASDDASAIHAVMKNVKFSRLSENGTYIKNSPDFINRTGDFIMDGNNGKIEITSDTGYDETSDQQAMFWSFELNWKFFDLEIDGNDLYPAAFRWAYPKAYHFENVWVHNFKNDGVSHRSIAFNVAIATTGTSSWNGGSPFGSYSSSQVFESGYVKDCTVQDIEAIGTGVPNGVAQAWWYRYESMDTANAIIYHSGNLIERCLGQEGEGMYINDGTFGGGGKDIIHNTTFTMVGDTIRDCSDRAMKITSSNINLINSRFEVIDPAYGNPQGGALIDVFTLLGSTYPDDYTNAFKMQECILIEENDPRGNLLRIGNVKNVDISGNTFSYPNQGNYQGITLGASGTTGTNGWVTNTEIYNNTFQNCGYQITNTITTEGTLNIHDDNLNYDITGTGGAATAVIRTSSSSGTHDDLNFYNLDITFTNTVNGFNGLLYSNGADWTNWTLSNITMTYTGGSGSTYFGYLKGDFNSTNTIDNCDIIGRSATGALIIDGIGNPVITNSTGDGATTLTVQ